jgi:hypothetical protein
MNEQIEEHKEAAREYLSKCNGGGSWFYTVSSENVLKRGMKAACYAAFRNVERHHVVGVGYFCPKEGPGSLVGEAWLKFITDKEKSPWRSFLKDDIEIIEDENYIRGFLLGEETLKSIPHKVLMNFLIASRHLNEFYEHINFWHKIVEAGVDVYRAYAYAGAFALYEGEASIRFVHVHNTNHWTLNNKPHMLNLVDSTPNLDHKSTNCIFSKSNSDFQIDDLGYRKYVAYNSQISVENFVEMDKKLTL